MQKKTSIKGRFTESETVKALKAHEEESRRTI
jgi:hypothetical protein